MDQNQPGRAAGSGPLATRGPADPPGPLDYLPQVPSYASLAAPGEAGPGDPSGDQAGQDNSAYWAGPPSRDHGYREEIPSAVYWRRRAIALVIGMAVLSLIAWAVNGVIGGQAAGQPASHPSGAPTTAGTNRHSAKDLSDPRTGAIRHGKPSPTEHRPAGDRTGGAGPARRHQASAQPAAPAATTSAVTGPGTQPACAPGTVVLTLRSPRYWYQPGTRPEFVVQAVSTASQPCTVNLGTRYVSVAVSAGPATIWTSATCVPRARSRLVVLQRGVPASVRATWDRRASRLGCQGHGDVARPGTYTAVASDGRLRSQTMVFVLSGPGVAVP